MTDSISFCEAEAFLLNTRLVHAPTAMREKGAGRALERLSLLAQGVESRLVQALVQQEGSRPSVAVNMCENRGATGSSQTIAINRGAALACLSGSP